MNHPEYRIRHISAITWTITRSALILSPLPFSPPLGPSLLSSFHVNKSKIEAWHVAETKIIIRILKVINILR
jgi:hypothetical protein